MKTKYFLIIVTFLFPLQGYSQESWSHLNYGFGFGRIGIANSSLKEKSVFNPFMQFELTFGRSLYRFVGLKASLGHSSNWIYTRAAFNNDGNSIELGEQHDSRLNTYLRSNAIRIGIGPQLRIYSTENKGFFLSMLYVPIYNYVNKLQYKVSGDSNTYGEDLNSGINALRHTIQIELGTIHDRSKTKGNFNTFSIFWGMDLIGYASDNKFRLTYLGLMFGI